jgi:serine/threonine protein kinase
MPHRGNRAVLESIPVSDRYTVDRELGRGGMALVYLARDRKHDRPVAVKILRPEIVAGQPAERFLLEIRILARLQHPHILALLDSGATDESSPRPFYVMPYVDGETLRQRLTPRDPCRCRRRCGWCGRSAKRCTTRTARD